MCLSSIKKIAKKGILTLPNKGEGWKDFAGVDINAGLYFRHYSFNNKLEVPRGKWLRAEETVLAVTHGQQYKSGFHVYLMEPPLSYLTTTLIRVKFKGVTCIGMQNGIQVAVARWMFVPKEKKSPNAQSNFG